MTDGLVANVLGSRYASERMRALWTPAHKVVLERRLWIAVMKAQRALGIDIPDRVIEAYEAALPKVNLDSIAAREAVTRHDVKARIEEFCALAGYEHIHRGMTSRDLTENVEQLQIRQSLEVIRDDLVALLVRLGDLAETYASMVIVARTHNVAAQPTTLGKRFADVISETILGFERIVELLNRYPLRGIKGPVGTRLDQIDLLGSPSAVAELEARVAEHCGFSRVLPTSAQVYPRSLDLDVVAALVQAVSAPSSLALTLRLMAGQELVSEGFQAGQVGSTAMPHKINARSAERVSALKTVLDGHLAMAASLSGRQWNEGDVSCSAARRVMLPDAFFATDGLLHTATAVIDDLEIFEGAITAELRRYLPLLVTTRVLSALVDTGMGRETAHELLAEHARATVHAQRNSGNAQPEKHPADHGNSDDNHRSGADIHSSITATNSETATTSGFDLFERLAADDRVPLDHNTLNSLISNPLQFTGTAEEQIADVVAQARAIAARFPAAAGQRAELRL